ncbi:hypothetical protein [Streptomyces olivaceus]
MRQASRPCGSLQRPLPRPRTPPAVELDSGAERDFAERIEDPEILWDCDGLLASSLAQQPPAAPSIDLQWIEDRFWVWVHYGVTKLGRGELFETIGFLAYLRDTVLGPLAVRRVGADPRGIRHLRGLGRAWRRRAAGAAPPV